MGVGEPKLVPNPADGVAVAPRSRPPDHDPGDDHDARPHADPDAGVE
jgi:hypothetical protein